MDDTLLLLKDARSELEGIDEVLDIQTEKYIDLQKKIGKGKTILFRTRNLMKKLEDAAKTNEILISIFIIFIFFTIAFSLIKYY